MGDITLEPGCQFEYSTKQFKELKYLEKLIFEFNKKTGLIGEKLGITWIGYGIQPLSTFENIESKWLTDLNEYGEKELAYILIGNKIDLKDSKVVTSKDGEELSEKINASDFVETSAKYGDNVEKAFEKLVFQIFENEGIEV